VEVLDNIPLELTPETVLEGMRMRRRSRAMDDMVAELVERARPVARPKALYDVCTVEGQGGDAMSVGGVTFTSRLMVDNFSGVERAFPFVSTCGGELDDLAIDRTDMMAVFVLDAIKMVALGAAGRFLHEHLKTRFGLADLSSMNPGDLASWPISQQGPLFSIFGDVEELIGVRLTDSFAMVPNKSGSGIYYQGESHFEDCMLCPIIDCPGRRLPYDAVLAERYQETS
jgi:hypothetical protein